MFEANRPDVRRLAADVAAVLDLPENWINDGVKGFLSAADDSTSTTLFATYLSEAEPGLRLFVASPEYLFAMKCLVMRLGGLDGNTDVDDPRFLASELHISTLDDALGIVARFYPAARISPKAQFGLEEIFGEPSQP